jgi:CHASE3 domain sensor protein/CheY-like chemotaxis protein
VGQAVEFCLELLNRVQDLELGQRGYLLTRSDAFLAPYDEARAAIPQALASLRSLVADNPDQTARVERMRPLIDELLTRATTTVELGRKGQFAEAIEIVRTGRGQQVLQSFRALVDGFRLAENGILDRGQAAESSARAIMLGLVLISLASAAVAALGALFMSDALIRELRERTEALAEETRVRKEAQAMLGAARVESVPAPQRKENARISSARPGEVVLIVEDDEEVCDSTVALLSELGYSVLAARNGDEALVRLQGSERIDILFTDVVLPQGMNGRALALAGSALRPGLPVLFTTGYARNAIIRNGGLDPGAHFLAKPYTQKEIAQRLRAALDAPAKA